MRTNKILGAAICGATLLAGGCRQANIVDNTSFKSAINNYYSARTVCLWTSPVKFPVQADTSNDEQTKGFDALTDAGLLQRASAEKKRFLIGSKQVNNYDLSDKGRSTWTADQTQPGYGNFCYGHREVTSIDGFRPSADSNATQYAVNYHYDATGVPDWAKTTEMKTAFPTLASDLSGQQTATANVTKTDSGLQVASIRGSASDTSLPQ
jgi:hypothetical protein